MVVYLDNIIIYSRTLKDHVHHFILVPEVFQANELYVKEKCAITQPEVSILGHNIRQGCITKLRSFLGLINFYGTL